MNIELEITLRCNVSCPQCSRHCPVVDYSDSDMTMGQILTFAKHVVETRSEIGILSIMGGEPLLHPHFVDIVRFLHRELLPSRVGLIQVATNGQIQLPDEVKTLQGLRIIVSNPALKRHRAQFVAPRDTGQLVKHCLVPATCGIAANAYGYFPCGAGGAIARLFGLREYALEEFPADVEESFADFRIHLCPLCQASAAVPLMLQPGWRPMSVSFVRAFKSLNGASPAFKRAWGGTE